MTRTVGSSPHMRGTLLAAFLAVSRTGIIPAYAGNTTLLVCPCADGGDHPRICGEHEVVTNYSDAAKGSSPHMRGTPSRTRCEGRQSGIIPAYAGNTRYFRLDFIIDRDHPRICGEHRSSTSRILSRSGSSPHMRGTRQLVGRGAPEGGIIPAYAGNTCGVSPPDIENRDHPRICGEHQTPMSLRRA